MKKEKILKTIGVIFIIGLVLAACGGAAVPAAPTATIAVKAVTTSSMETASPAPLIPTASPTPLQPTPTSTPALPAMKEYKNSSNSFSISAPADWTLSEDVGYASFTSPDQAGYAAIRVENTLNALDAETFTKAINAYEFNTFSNSKNYKETKRDVQADNGYAIITKTLDSDTVPSQASTIYEQKGKVLYIVTYLSAVSAVSQSGPIFTAMGNSFKPNPAYAEDFTPFTTAAFGYTDPDNLYRLIIPRLWTFNDQNKDGSVITFTSPDTTAMIMLYKTDLGKKVIRILADSTALEFLKSMSTTKDTRVSVMNILENGSIKMDWSSKSSAIQGTSIYKWNGTTWFILTWLYNNISGKSYEAAFEKYIATYELLE